MKHIYKKVFPFILSFIIILNFFTLNVYATEHGGSGGSWVPVPDDSQSDLDIIAKNIPDYILFLLAQTGITTCDRNMNRVVGDTEKWFDEHRSKMYIVEHSGTHKRAIKIDKSVTDELINNIKEATKEPENGGYELVKTVPLSKVSTLYFYKPQQFKTLVNLINDNNGLIGLTINGSIAYFYKLDSDALCVKYGSKGDINNGDEIKSFYSVCFIKNSNSGAIRYNPLYNKSYDTAGLNWEDNVNLYTATSGSYPKNYFSMLDAFEFLKSSYAESVSTKPFTSRAFVITKSGASLPVFNTLNDAIEYSVEHNLYYTGSDYTGEGKEIIIPLDEIDKILNGYYSGMYDLLQQLIEQNGGNALTPEQLQKLVDEVKASFGMIQDTIDKGFAEQDILIQKNSQILQNIADALNKFFSQSKESRTAFLKEFKDYAKDQQTRDDALYKLISDYIESTKNNNPDTSEPSLPPPPAPGDNTDTTDSSAWHEKLYNTIKKGFDDVINGLKQGFSSVVDELKKIKRWTALDTILDGAGAVGEWVSLLTDLLDPEKRFDTLTDFVSIAMDTLNDTTNLIKGKFPFCIPMDILALVETLSAEPQTPVFKIPFVIESWDIHAEVEIDLKDFNIISDISRTFLTILWCCALMNFTTKITDMKNI